MRHSFLLFYHDDSILDRAIEDTLREIISTALEKPTRQKMFEAKVRLTSTKPLRDCATDSDQLDIIRQLNHITTILLDRSWFFLEGGESVFLQVTKAWAVEVRAHFEGAGIKGLTQKQVPLDPSQVLIKLSTIPSLEQLKEITMMAEGDEQAAETSVVSATAGDGSS